MPANPASSVQGLRPVRQPTSKSTDGLFNTALQLQRDQIRSLGDYVVRLERRLQAQAEQNQRLSDDHPVAYIELLPNGIIRSGNAAAAELFGVDKLPIRPLSAFISRADIEPLYRHMHQCLTAGRERGKVETDIQIRSGDDWKPVRLISRPVQRSHTGNNKVIPTALVDMTEDRASRHWAALEDRNFQQLVESIDGIVWEAEYPLRFRFVSPQAERVTGYTPDEFLRNPTFWQEHIHIDDRERVIAERTAAILAGGHHIIDYRMHSARTGLIWLRDSVFITRNAQGHTLLQGLAVNITPLKQAEAELRRANQQLATQAQEHRRHLEQTVQSMETFCYGIAHELRAPVRAARGFSDLLARETAVAQDKLTSDYARRIAQASAYMDKLIEDLLNYGRLHHTEMTLVGVRVTTTVERVLQHLAPEIQRQKANVVVLPTSERVQAHPTLLGQALENLVSNALKFVPAGTSPHITIDTDRTARDRVRISVRDKGLGIDPAWQEKIFGVFQRAHGREEFPGTGIGLALVKRIVDLMDGKVGVTSSPGLGSCFWIELPPPRAGIQRLI